MIWLFCVFVSVFCNACKYITGNIGYDGLLDSNADVKTWIGPNTDFPASLSAQSIVQMDTSYDSPIRFREHTQYNVCEVVLPTEAEIIFASDFSMTIGGSKECTHTEKFSVKKRSYWLDPNNWNSTKTNLATPDLYRLPCVNDVAVLPSDTVAVYTPDLLIHQLIINQKTFDQESLIDFVESETGSRMFLEDPAFDQDIGPMKRLFIMLQGSCTDPTGCPCFGNGYGDRDESCHVAREYCVKEPPCVSPILPEGACCPVCGAQILFNITSLHDFNMNRFKTKVKQVVAEFSTQYKTVDVHVSRLIQGIQVVLVEHGDYEGYVEQAAEMVKRVVLADPSLHVGLYRRVFHSGYPYNPKGGASVFQIFMVTFLLSLGVLVVLYVHYYHNAWSFLGLGNIGSRLFPGLGRSHPDSTFVFKRFDNESKEEPVVYEVTPRVPSKAFDNPMYNVDTSKTAMDPTEKDNTTTQSFQELKEKYEDDSDED